MNPILPHPYNPPGIYCLCTVPGSFSMAGTTSASRPASNLIPKHLISNPPAGAYAALTIKKRAERTTMYSPAPFFMSRSTSASWPALNRKSSRISDDYEIVGNKRAACFTSGREGFSIPSFLQKCRSQNPSPAIPVELHRPAILMFMARTRKFHRNFCRPADFRSAPTMSVSSSIHPGLPQI